MKATGDVCERCRWQRKRAKRSGSGRNSAQRTASEEFRAPQQAVGLPCYTSPQAKSGSRNHGWRPI